MRCFHEWVASAKNAEESCGRHVWSGADDARQRILDLLKFARVELGDAIEDIVTVVQPQAHDGAGDGAGEILVDRTTDVADCTQMVAACVHNAGNAVVENQTAVQRCAQNSNLLDNNEMVVVDNADAVGPVQFRIVLPDAGDYGFCHCMV